MSVFVVILLKHLKQNTMKTQKDYNKIVNVADDGEITVLDYVFTYEDGMSGATGSKFYPVSTEEIDECIADYLDDDIELLVYFAENFGDLTADMIRNVDSSREALIELFYDSSYIESWDYLRTELNLGETSAEIFDCVGGGRCFDENFKGNKNTELSLIIRKYESK